ncbi:mechanosensitive ion channel domain-containing protein [Thioclava sp. GXIMD4216]|uniref:Mechanosensitive ion channel n=1 Tax=Thioclava litoralis TaxID=3076557 RepID=A0ABZ1E0H3_9RHOB|nr:mechanosensitive ion channel [Thioclava sp. FTW29]
MASQTTPDTGQTLEGAHETLPEGLQDLETAVNDAVSTAVDHASRYLPDWAVSTLVLAMCLLLALALHRVVRSMLDRMVRNRDLFWRSLVGRSTRPLRLLMIVLALGIGISVAPLSEGAARLISHLLLIAFILCLAWIAHTALYIWTTLHMRRFKLDAEDNLLARKHVTQARILLRVANVAIVVLAVAAALMTVPAVRQYGVSLLAAGGAAGIVVGLALQPILKNLIAGIQLALTQPIRIDDALIVEGEWGWVEEITSTYVVLKLWDWRRLVVPLSYFIEQPFQNWTRENAELIGTCMFYLDHSAPIADLRKAGQKIAEDNRLWDGKVYAMQVTDFRERVMEVRVLVSARTAPRVFDLRCEMREGLIDYIQREIPSALPKTRAEAMLNTEPGPGRALPETDAGAQGQTRGPLG